MQAQGTLGLIVNPHSGRDTRRLFARAGTSTIEDKRNELYTRRERSKRLFGKYPMVRYDNGWMWTYVGNFNIDVSTTGYNDPRVKSNAVLEKVFKSLPLSQFEKL